MARIIYSALVESIRGSIGGTTFQRNQYGYTVKKKPSMVVPNSQAQRLRKVGFIDIAGRWRALTQIERDNWNTYATTFPRPTRLNPDSYLNGFNYFVLFNLYRRNFTAVVLENPSFVQQTFGSVQPIIAGDEGELYAAVEAEGTSGEWFYLFYLTRELPDTQNWIGSRYRFVAVLESPNEAFDITAAYTEVFGDIPSVGDVIGVRLVQMSQTSAQLIEYPAVLQQVIEV